MSKPKKPAPKASAKKTPAKPAAKAVAKPVAKKPAHAPAKTPAKKPAPAPIKKAALVAKKAVPAKKVAAAPAKTVPVKKTAPAKPVSKPAAKAPAKPEPKAAPAKVSAKPASKAAPVAAKAPVKTPPAKASAKAPAASSSKKKGPVMNHDVAVKTLTDHRVKHKQEAPTSKKIRRNAPIAFSLDDVEEYLKTRGASKLNLYVPGQDEAKVAAGKAAAKAAVKAVEKPVQNRQVTAVSVADLLGFNPFVKKGDSTPEEELIPQKFRKYYKLLLELRDHVNEGLATHTEEALKKTGKEDTGDVSAYSQHMADAGTDSFDRDFALSLVNNEQEALYEIAEAIDRMKDGSYGTCEITQKAIPHERLVAVPFTRYSAEGQRQVEKNKRRGRRSNGNPLLEINEGVGFGTSGGEEGEGEEP